jgi:hypothetical protein
MNNKKNNKANQNVSKKTLDIQHMNKLTQVQELELKQQQLKEANKNITKHIEEIQQLKKDGSLNEEQINQLITLLDERLDVNRELEQISQQMNEVDYYIGVGHTLFKYYDIIEKGLQDEEPDVNTISNDSILKFFMKPASTEADDQSMNKPHVTESQTNTDNRATLLDRYMCAIDSHHIPQATSLEVDECCKYCKSKNVCLLWNDGINHCQDCGSIEQVTVEHEKPSYHQSNTEITYFAYKRINHLNECISQIQGKETTDIPQEVYDMILLEIKKQKITNMADLTPKKLRGILKKLKLNRYYEHLIHLVNKLTGINIPHFDPEIEERIRTMFKLVQPAFLKHAPKNRKNFLSYNYTLRKCIQLLERDEYLHLFPALKSREKTFEQDKIWKKICQELNWEFIPSI